MQSIECVKSELGDFAVSILHCIEVLLRHTSFLALVKVPSETYIFCHKIEFTCDSVYLQFSSTYPLVGRTHKTVGKWSHR